MYMHLFFYTCPFSNGGSTILMEFVFPFRIANEKLEELFVATTKNSEKSARSLKIIIFVMKTILAVFGGDACLAFIESLRQILTQISLKEVTSVEDKVQCLFLSFLKFPKQGNDLGILISRKERVIRLVREFPCA